MAFDAFAGTRISFQHEDIFQDGHVSDAFALMGALGRPAGGYVGQNISGSIVIDHTDECCPCGHDHGYEVLIEKAPAILGGDPFIATPEADIPNDDSTSASVAVGGSFVGEIEVSGDTDWIRVDLVAGQEYEFRLTGTGTDDLDDPLLRLLDSSGNQLAVNDDINLGTILDSRILFTAATTGTYYLEAGAYTSSTQPGTTGEYTLTADEYVGPPDYTLDEAANFITDEFSSRTAYADMSLTYNVTDLTAAQANLARLALQAWADITPLTFTEVTGTAQLTFDNEIGDIDPDIPGDTGAQAFNSNTTSNGTILSSSITVSSNWSGGNTAIDSYTYQTYLHEIGHALGLGHAGPYNGNGSYVDDALYAQDSWMYSVMSYFDGIESGFGDYRFVLGPQIVDIVAIQDLYGANPNGTRTGNTTYGFNSTETDIHDFSAFNRPPSLTIYDTGGTDDTLDVSGYSANQTISLIPESFSDIGNYLNTSNGDQGGNGVLDNIISIARGTIIENAVGGSGDDTIIGNDASNELSGGFGNDIITGGAGDDTLIGGSGDDVFVMATGSGTDTITDFSTSDIIRFTSFTQDEVDAAYAARTTESGGTRITFGSDSVFLSGVAAASLTTANFQGDGTTTPPPSSDINGTEAGETLLGTDDADTINGLGGSDLLQGLGNNDQLNGGAGNDTLEGGDGNDVLNGGQGNDNLYGGDGSNSLIGGAGDDYFYGSASDSYNGGSGYDTVILQDLYTAGINLDLGAAGIERVFATNVADVLNAATSTTAVVLYGFGGADTLIGGAGSDYLYFDNDDIANGSLDGGAGFDYLLNNSSSSFTGTLTVNVASYNAEGYYGSAGTEIIDASGVTVAATIYTNGGADEVIGSANGDYIYIDAQTASVDAGAGYDYIVYNQFDGSGANVVLGNYNAEGAVGRAGDDTFDATGNTIGASLYGAEGNDTLIGGTVTDYLYGDVGDDTLTGNEGYDYFVTYANWGNDTITDFTEGGDAILFAISGLNNFNQISITQDGSDAIITYLGNTLRLTGVDSTTLTSDSFVISPPASSIEAPAHSQESFDFGGVTADTNSNANSQILELITDTSDATLFNDVNHVDTLIDIADVNIVDLFEVNDEGIWFISA